MLTEFIFLMLLLSTPAIGVTIAALYGEWEEEKCRKAHYQAARWAQEVKAYRAAQKARSRQ